MLLLLFVFYYSPALKKWGYTGFAVSFRHSVTLWVCDSVTFQMKIFVTLFSGTVRPGRLKLGTHVDSGQMYRVYRNRGAPAYSSLYFFIFLSVQFSNIEIFRHIFSGTVRSRRLKLGTHVDSGKMYRVYQNQAAAAYFSIHFSFSPIFKHWNILSQFSQELWGLEGWNLVHTWTVGRCIVYTRFRLLLLLIHPFIFHFSFYPVFKH